MRFAEIRQRVPDRRTPVRRSASRGGRSMSRRGHDQIRQSQVITTYGPSALIDLPRHSAIVGGLDTWPNPGSLDEITEPRLTRKLGAMTGVPLPKLYAPPPEPNEPWAPARGIGAWRFPEVVRRAGSRWRRSAGALAASRAPQGAGPEGARFDGHPVVPICFVRACPRGHVDDIDWAGFVHGPEDRRRRQLWLEEGGYDRRLARSGRGLRMQQETTTLRGGGARPEPARHVPRFPPAARHQYERRLQPSESTAHPHRLQRVLSSDRERALSARSRDGEAVFTTSANLTDAALDRNIELGVLIRDRALAASVTSHFQGLIDREILRPLPTD